MGINSGINFIGIKNEESCITFYKKHITFLLTR